MKEFMNKSWTFYPQIPAVLRIYHFMSGKPGLIKVKHKPCINFSISYTLNKPITKMYSCNQRMFLEASTSDVLQSCSCNMSMAVDVENN
jgi:hypothetical protein